MLAFVSTFQTCFMPSSRLIFNFLFVFIIYLSTNLVASGPIGVPRQKHQERHPDRLPDGENTNKNPSPSLPLGCRSPYARHAETSPNAIHPYPPSIRCRGSSSTQSIRSHRPTFLFDTVQALAARIGVPGQFTGKLSRVRQRCREWEICTQCERERTGCGGVRYVLGTFGDR